MRICHLHIRTPLYQFKLFTKKRLLREDNDMTKIIIKSLCTFEVFTEIDCADTNSMSVREFACTFFEQASLHYRFSLKTTPISSQYMIRDHITPSDFVFICEGIRFDASERGDSYRNNLRLSHFVPANQQTCRVYAFLAVYGKSNYCLNGSITIARLDQPTFTHHNEQSTTLLAQSSRETSLTTFADNNHPSRTSLISPIPDQSIQYNFAVTKLFWQNKHRNNKQSDKRLHNRNNKHLPSVSRPQAMTFWKEKERTIKRDATTSPHFSDVIETDLSNIKSFWQQKNNEVAQAKFTRK